ncbi:hypothetical protein HY612_00915 [Candidatus Roizmanbacteria bacterium]|nr:hypothetical protein [Candidatus Roizmanbacteria bacterium]
MTKERKKERVQAFNFPSTMSLGEFERRLAEELFAEGKLVAAFRYGHKGLAAFVLNRALISRVDGLEIKYNELTLHQDELADVAPSITDDVWGIKLVQMGGRSSGNFPYARVTGSLLDGNPFSVKISFYVPR